MHVVVAVSQTLIDGLIIDPEYSLLPSSELSHAQIFNRCMDLSDSDALLVSEGDHMLCSVTNDMGAIKVYGIWNCWGNTAPRKSPRADARMMDMRHNIGIVM
jgi:hypothetical protein